MAVSNTHKLYNSELFRFPKLKGFEHSRSKLFKSIYNGNNSQSTLYYPAIKAFMLLNANGYDVTNPIITAVDDLYSENNQTAMVGKIGDNLIVAEYFSGYNVLERAVFNCSLHEFQFAEYSEDGGENFKPYKLYENNCCGIVLWLALIPYFMEESSEIRDCINISKNGDLIKQALYNDNFYQKDFLKNAFIFCDSCYWQIGTNIDVFLPSNTEFCLAKDASVFEPDIIIAGKKQAEVTTNETEKDNDIFCKFALKENMTDEELEKVPRMPDYYDVPEFVLKRAHNIQYSFKNPTPNFTPYNYLMCGEVGSGKTEACKALASCLGLPFGHISMSPNSDEITFTGTFMPRCDSKTSKAGKFANIEELAQAIEISPETAYFDITGDIKEDATLADCISAYAEEYHKANSTSSTLQYEFVESCFAQLIEHGGVITIEEFTNCRDSGVAIIINQLMDGYQEITLPNGRVIKRNPYSIIAFASNVDEQQTTEFQTSTLSRMHSIMRVDTPNRNKLIKRVSRMTSFNDNIKLNLMADVIISLRNYIKDHGYIGASGVREFAHWIEEYVALCDYNPQSTLREAAMNTIVPAASPHSEDINDIIRDVIDTLLGNK